MKKWLKKLDEPFIKPGTYNREIIFGRYCFGANMISTGKDIEITFYLFKTR